MLVNVDHIVYATPDLDAGVDLLEGTLGVRAVIGGRHPAWATRNALIALGDRVYLEIVGPDRDAPAPEGRRPFGIDALRSPRLATWVVGGTALEELAAKASANGVELGDIQSRSRLRPDGTLLCWTMTDITMDRVDGLIPCFIDWGDTPHPATTSPRGGTPVGLRARHPEPERVRAHLRALGLDLDVEAGNTPELVAAIETARGMVEIH
jgi:catechol 2,3-dioxygenase-like lactoylglutathione lyase family enzyme